MICIDIVNKFVVNLRETNTFDRKSDPGGPIEAPGVLLWALFLQSHLLEMCGYLTQVNRFHHSIYFRSCFYFVSLFNASIVLFVLFHTYAFSGWSIFYIWKIVFGMCCVILSK
jgi:hypothetical protein